MLIDRLDVGKEMNVYAILRVPENADTETIKKAYRKLVKECHPDSCPGDGAVERFEQISEAYAILSDEEKRKQYDRKRSAGTVKKSRAKTKPDPIDAGTLFERYMGFR